MFHHFTQPNCREEQQCTQVFEEICNEVNIPETQIVTEPQCRTVTEEVCEDALPGYGAPSTNCYDTTEEVCNPGYVDICTDEPICNTITEYVTETQCSTVDVQKCDTIQDEVCEPVYQQKCDTVTTQACRYVYIFIYMQWKSTEC